MVSNELRAHVLLEDIETRIHHGGIETEKQGCGVDKLRAQGCGWGLREEKRKREGR